MAEQLPPLPSGATMDSTPPLPAGATMDAVPPLPAGATMEGAPRPARAAGSPSMDLQAKPTRSIGERAKEVGLQTGMGGVIGTFAPEITTAAGYGMMAFPPTAPFAPAVIGAGQAMRGSRLAQAGLGALSGFGGEVSAQAAEAMGAGRTGQEIARLAGGVVTPEFANVVKFAGGKLLGLTGLATKTDVSSIVGALTKDLGLDVKQLSPSQRAYIEKVAEQIRAGAPSEQFAKTVYSALERNTADVVDAYNFQARQLESQADALVKAAEAARAGRMAGSQQQALALQAQFESASKSLKDLARQRAANIIKNADAMAAQNRAAAAGQSPGARQIQEVEINDMLQKARTEAQSIIADAERRTTKLREVASRTTARVERGAEQARGQVAAVGAPVTPTQTGEQIRQAVTPIFDRLKAVRAQNAEQNKGEAFSFAKQKELSGVMPKDTQAFKSGMAEIQKLLDDTTLADIKAPIQRIKQALDPVRVEEGVVVGKPANFEALEQVRRFLRDRSYGLPAEGFDAINQQTAGRLADIVENIQREFSPGIGRFLEQYRKDSEPLRVFKTKLGEAIVGKEEFDMARFVTDPATLGSKFFKTEGGVKQLVELLGGDKGKAEQIARGFVGDQLRGADSKLIARKVGEWRDWLPQFPALQSQLQQAERQLAQTERTGARRGALAEKLQTEARGLPAKAEEAAGKLEADVLEAGKRRITEAAEAESKVETAAAAKEAARLRGEAKQLSAEGERIRNEIMGKTFDARRVREVILSGDRNLWREVGPMISGDPAAKAAFGDALRQVIADKATQSPGSIRKVFAEDVRPALEATGLVPAREIAKLQGQIDQINRTVEGPQRIPAVIRLIRNAVVGEAARIPTAAVGAISGE